MKFTKRITLSYDKILRGKKSNFLNKSLIKYVTAAALFTIVKPNLFGHWGMTFLGLVAIFTVVSFIVMVQSAKFMGKKLKLDANIHFDEVNIEIDHLDEKLDTTTIKWSSIKKVRELKETFVIDLDKRAPHMIFIKKEDLTGSEINYFKEKI